GVGLRLVAEPDRSGAARRGSPAPAAAGDAARHRRPRPPRRTRDPLPSPDRGSGPDHPADRPLRGQARPGGPGDRLDQGPLPRAVQRRGLGLRSQDEHVRAAPPLQGRDQHEPAAVPEAPQAAGGAAPDPGLLARRRDGGLERRLRQPVAVQPRVRPSVRGAPDARRRGPESFPPAAGGL
ncbi:MAG: Transcriptional regulator, AraC family, partial [uncultured Rubrobacteraceae bacterium]